MFLYETNQPVNLELPYYEYEEFNFEENISEAECKAEFRVFVAGCLVLGKEVCTALATSNRLQETALLCIGIGELTKDCKLGLSGQMAMINSDIGILKLVKGMVYELEISISLFALKILSLTSSSIIAALLQKLDPIQQEAVDVAK
ncbi:unnamed protein product [Pocillopora meandrina]|uniref:Uncharacterized protein n=1 Tax=Pocillopora meandrina TaxID=46732 RepID=A0AAU9VS10_9CNID|nr:unnamed protein product [Pocillopora meandrina]